MTCKAALACCTRHCPVELRARRWELENVPTRHAKQSTRLSYGGNVNKRVSRYRMAASWELVTGRSKASGAGGSTSRPRRGGHCSAQAAELSAIFPCRVEGWCDKNMWKENRRASHVFLNSWVKQRRFTLPRILSKSTHEADRPAWDQLKLISHPSRAAEGSGEEGDCGVSCLSLLNLNLPPNL